MREEDSDPGLGIVKYRFLIVLSGSPAAEQDSDGSAIACLPLRGPPDHDPLPTEHVNAGDIVIDIGAHVGMFTHFALTCGAAKVLMLEPDPINVECLRRNFPDEIASGRVILLPEGAWDTEGTLQFHIGVTNSGVGSLSGISRITHLEARVRPVDSMVTEFGLQRVDLVKIDIEGAERHALKGHASSIAAMEAAHPDRHVSPAGRPGGPPADHTRRQSGLPVGVPVLRIRSDDGTIRPHATLFY